MQPQAVSPGRLDRHPPTTEQPMESDMTDETEDVRRILIETGQPEADLKFARKRWSTDELRAEFEVIGFMAPFVAVKRKADGVKGSLEFTHSPRWYFNFVKDEK